MDRENESALQALSDLREGLMSALDDVPPRARELLLESIEFRETLSTESDRGAALMAAAFLDEKLKRLLLASFVNDRRSAEAALVFNGPAGTFSGRIELAYLMGMVPLNARSDLHLIRKIRNEFAHIAGPLDFDSEKIAPRCHQLELHDSSGATAIAKFRRTVMRLLSWIDLGLENAEHATAPADIDPARLRDQISGFRQAWEEDPARGRFPLTEHFPFLVRHSAPAAEGSHIEEEGGMGSIKG